MTIDYNKIDKCRKDIVYFAENFFYVETLNGKEKIKLYKGQKKLLKKFTNENRFFSIKKDRDVGVTTVNEIYILWNVIFKQHKNIAIVTENLQGANRFKQKIIKHLNDLPNYLKPLINTNRVCCYLELSNFNSIIFVSKRTPNNLIGYSVNNIIFDNISSKNDIAFLNKFISQTLPVIYSYKNSKIIFSSDEHFLKGPEYTVFDYWGNGTCIQKTKNNIISYKNSKRKIKLIKGI